jgi:hypothetical protein
LISRVKFLPIAWAWMPKTIFRKNSDSLYLRLTYVNALSLISLKQIFINPECDRQDNKT